MESPVALCGDECKSFESLCHPTGELANGARICTNHCDRRHSAAFQDGRHSSCQHGSGARKKALSEPGDTRRQWKGEAAACFVHTGIASSRTLPTSSVGYWSPLLSLCNASASEATCSFGGDFFAFAAGSMNNLPSLAGAPLPDPATRLSFANREVCAPSGHSSQSQHEWATGRHSPPRCGPPETRRCTRQRSFSLRDAALDPWYKVYDGK